MKYGIIVSEMFVHVLAVSSVILAHSWFPPECCGESDCREAPCEQLIQERDGVIRYNGMEYRGDMIRATKDRDGKCFVCHTMRPYCVFIAPNT